MWAIPRKKRFGWIVVESQAHDRLSVCMYICVSFPFIVKRNLSCIALSGTFFRASCSDAYTDDRVKRLHVSSEIAPQSHRHTPASLGLFSDVIAFGVVANHDHHHHHHNNHRPSSSRVCCLMSDDTQTLRKKRKREKRANVRKDLHCVLHFCSLAKSMAGAHKHYDEQRQWWLCVVRRRKKYLIAKHAQKTVSLPQHE